MYKVIIVTGAAQGIGASIVYKLLQQGTAVIGIDCQSEPAEWESSRQLTPEQQSCWYPTVLDIGNATEIEHFFNTYPLLKSHSLSGLVNAAGILRMGSLLDAPLSDWQHTLQINLLGPVLISQAAARLMIPQRHGSIVTISSNAARVPRSNMGIYATSKAALSHFCKNLALELAPHGIRCNIVAPGSTLTQMQKQLWTDNQPPAAVLQGDLSQYRTGIPLQRIAEAEDIANSVLFLLSDAARQITMHELVVDGGATLGV